MVWITHTKLWNVPLSSIGYCLWMRNVCEELLSLGAFGMYWHTIMEFRPNAKGRTITMVVQMIPLVAKQCEQEWVVLWYVCAFRNCVVEMNSACMQMQFVYFKIFRLFEISSHIFPTTALTFAASFPSACYRFPPCSMGAFVCSEHNGIHGKCLQMQKKIMARDMFVEIETEWRTV